MDIQKTIEFILEQQAQAEVHRAQAEVYRAQTEKNLASITARQDQAEQERGKDKAYLRHAVRLAIKEVRSERQKRRELDEKITQLAAAQLITEEKFGQLAAAHSATEEKLGQLAAAHSATEEKLGQLAAAHSATEENLGQLAAAHSATEESLKAFIDSMRRGGNGHT